MSNWFNRQQQKSRYNFSIVGDLFIDGQENKEVERYEAEEKLIGILPTQEGLRINDYKIEPHSSL